MIGTAKNELNEGGLLSRGEALLKSIEVTHSVATLDMSRECRFTDMELGSKSSNANMCAIDLSGIVHFSSTQQ